MSHPPRRFARSEAYELRVIDEETVLVPARSASSEADTVYALNQVGAAIWRLIEPARDAAEIARCLAEEYDVSVEKASEDVAAFLALLADKGLVIEI